MCTLLYTCLGCYGCESICLSGGCGCLLLFFIYFGRFSVELHSLKRIRNKQTATVILRFVFFLVSVVRTVCRMCFFVTFFSPSFWLTLAHRIPFFPKNFNTGSLTMSFLRLLLTKTNGFFHPKRSNGSVSFTAGVHVFFHFLRQFILSKNIF